MAPPSELACGGCAMNGKRCVRVGSRTFSGTCPGTIEGDDLTLHDVGLTGRDFDRPPLRVPRASSSDLESRRLIQSLIPNVPFSE